MIAPQPNWATDAGAVVEPTAATTASVATTALVKAHVLCNRLFNVFPFEWITECYCRTRRWRGDAAAVSRQRTRRKVTTQSS